VSKKKPSLGKCLNCDYEFRNESEAEFCPKCGQKNTDRRIGLFTLLMDFLGDYFTFDSKLFRSLKHLFLSPGYLTDAFNNGRRVRYVPPLRMYLFISFIFFFVLRIYTSSDFSEHKPIFESDVLDEFERGFETSRGEDSFESYRDSILMLYFDLDNTSQITDEHKDDFIDNYNGEILIEKGNIESWFGKLFYRKLGGILRATPNRMLNTFLKYVPIALFIAMPIFALLLFLFFRNENKFYIEHLIHSIHLHTWYFILVILFRISGISNDSFAEFALYFFLLLYELLSVVYVYKQGYLKSMLKLLGVNILYSIFLIFILTSITLLSLSQL